MFFVVVITLPVELADAVYDEHGFAEAIASWNQMRQRLNQYSNRWIWSEKDWFRLFGLPCRRFHCNIDQWRTMLRTD
jgi:hypothetical protein